MTLPPIEDPKSEAADIAQWFSERLVMNVRMVSYFNDTMAKWCVKLQKKRLGIWFTIAKADIFAERCALHWSEHYGIAIPNQIDVSFEIERRDWLSTPL